MALKATKITNYMVYRPCKHTAAEAAMTKIIEPLCQTTKMRRIRHGAHLSRRPSAA
jgi:hypothetical protein